MIEDSKQVSYLEREYEVDCDGIILKLKPRKVWFLYNRLRGRNVKVNVLAVFMCPPARPVVKKIDEFYLEY